MVCYTPFSSVWRVGVYPDVDMAQDMVEWVFGFGTATSGTWFKVHGS